MLCDGMLGMRDILHLPTSFIQQSQRMISSGSSQPASAAVPPPRSEPAQEEPQDTEQQDEITRLCSEYDTSTKILALISDLEKIRSHSWISDPDFRVDQDHPMVVERVAELAESPEIAEKSVVFSQWTTMLNLIEPQLKRNNIRFARLDGTMSRMQRTANLAKFKNDPGVRVLLVSLKAGGVGLNLAYATHVFVMDAFWNPSVEHQAIDRVHRLGQTKPVSVTRYFVRDSIEEKILKLQQRKGKIVDISLMDKERAQNPDSLLVGENENEEELNIGTGAHSRQQRLDDLSML
ncbi:hypothetical protein EC988_008320, partial [Linderina pennispora]